MRSVHELTWVAIVAVALMVALIPVPAAVNEPAGDDPYVVVLGIAQPAKVYLKGSF